jgi:hypothetical protein
VDERPFGARFIQELRRLTQSTAGYDYREVQRISTMDLAEFRAALGDRLAPPAFWEDPAVSPSPEKLAQDIFARRSDDVSVLISLLGGFT